MIPSCPFCQNPNCIPVKNSLGKHWVNCRSCKANGPHADTEAAAAAVWVVQPVKSPGLLATLASKLKR